MKLCSKCSQEKPVTAFYKKKRPDGSHGLTSRCRECTCVDRCDHFRNNPEDLRGRNLQKYWGVSKRDALVLYLRLFREQEGRCKICLKHQSSEVKSLAVDHCHETGIIRGLLCNNCNTGIGFLSDRSKDVELAANYLRKMERYVRFIEMFPEMKVK